MAALKLSSACLRRLSENVKTEVRSAQRSTRRGSRRCLHTSTPLYLDFVAPSWRTTETPMRQSSCSRQAAQLPRITRRTFTHSPSCRAKAILNPRQDESGDEMSITITPRAAHRLQSIAEKESNPELALRVSVESGGCHGFQYLMSLVKTSEIDEAEDTLFENEGSAGTSGNTAEYKAKVVMDEPSLELLKGSSVDYTMELIGSQFKVTGIPGAKSSCGCGTSFDIAT